MDIMKIEAYDVNAKEWIAPSKCLSCVSPCGSNRCLCCKTLDTNTVFNCFSTGRRFILNYPDTFNCKSKCVIYLITCRSCGVQYVGQTKQSLHCRLNGHRQSVKNNKLNTYLSNHFKSMGHSWDDVSIQIIDRVDIQNKSDLDISRELNMKEDFYIKTLNTLHPLGLNDRILGGGCASQSTVDGFAFFSSTINRRKRSHGKRKSSRKKTILRVNECEEILRKLQNHLSENEICKFYQYLKSLSNGTLKNIYSKLLDQANDLSFVLTTYMHNRLRVHNTERSSRDRNHIIIPFRSHKIDQLQLASIVNDKSVCTLIPDKVKYLYPPKVYYKLNNPNCLRFCNYNKFLNKVTMEEVSNIIQNNCSCDLMPDFIYQPYGHILTGNLDIIKNPELKELFSYGAKHRLPKSISWQATEKEILESLNQHVVSISKRFHLSTSDFSEWKSRIMTLVKHRIFRLNKNNQGRVTFNYNNKAIEITLNELQKIFVIAPVDKASNNFSFICKKFYLKVLLEELGFDLSSLNPIGNITYKPENISESEILNKHLKDLLAMFQIKCTDKDIRLPKLFWIPKLHKNPYKFRFIAGARHCTTKTLSINVNRGLKVVRDNFHIYCESIKKNTGYRYFWSVASTQEFLNNISNVNVHSMQVYDFSTLYTNLEHNDIRNNIFSILDLVFNSSNRKYLCVGYDRSFFAKSQYKNFSCFNVDSFKKAIDYVISEVYVTFAGKVFKQVRGVPMGGNSSPLLADLFLLNCEFSYMKQIVKDKKFGLAKLLSNTSRYIDDVSVVNYKHFDIE